MISHGVLCYGWLAWHRRRYRLQAARSGHDVAFTYVSDENAALDVVRKALEIRPDGRCRAYRLDVRKSPDVEKVGAEVLADFDSGRGCGRQCGHQPQRLDRFHVG